MLGFRQCLKWTFRSAGILLTSEKKGIPPEKWKKING
jgi:hypothetical protein